MSLGQSARNGNSVEPGLPNTFAMPKARSRLKVASLTLTDFALAGLREDIGLILNSQPSLRAKRSNPSIPAGRNGLLRRFAPRNDSNCYHVATPFMVGCPSAFAVHKSMPPEPLSLALIENSLPSNSGCTPR